MSKKVQRPRRRAANLAGTNLFLDTRTGIYQWRGVDPVTGRRRQVSTGCRNLKRALVKAAHLEEAREKRKAGIESFDCWGTSLEPLVEPWLDSLSLTPSTRRDYGVQIRRALSDLSLSVAADLDDVASVDARLVALDRPLKTKRRCYQDSLRRFSSWLSANKRVLDRDPLATWKLLDVSAEPNSRPRRAPMPDEVARALHALDALDVIHHRKHPQRAVFTALLVLAPRAEAFVSRDLEHLTGTKVYFGANVKKKRRGAGELDDKTAAEIAESLRGRSEGPLFLSPQGGRWSKRRLLSAWKEAFGLALVAANWPEEEAPEVNLAHFVNQTLSRGMPALNRGGRVKSDPGERERKLKTMNALEAQINGLANRVRPAWELGMRGIDVHGLRKTHRTWAEAAGVQPRAIDKQLGHAAHEAQTSDLARFLAGSKTGGRYYVDRESPLFRAQASAQAVREILERAFKVVPSLFAAASSN